MKFNHSIKFIHNSDFDNTPPDLTYGTVNQRLFLSTYDGAAGLRANKKDFVLKHEGVPIYSKTFNPVGTSNYNHESININSHFFNTNEELTYTPDSTFIGIASALLFQSFDCKYCWSSYNIITSFMLKFLMKIGLNYTQDLNMLQQVMQ